MKNTKTLTAFLFITILLFFIGLLLTLLFLVLFFKKVEASLGESLVILLALVLPVAVVSGISLLAYFLIRKKVNEIESANEDKKEVSEDK